MAIPTSPPSGFRDFPPEDCARREFAIQTISKVYRNFGFEPIATSAMEDLAVLTGKGGGENEKLIFKILKRGEKLDGAKAAGGELADLGLRFDLTLPLGRFYAKQQSLLPHPFKAFHIGPVWRAERAQKGRYREFYQCDADIVGSESPLCEVEIISAILAAFEALGLPEISVALNDRSLLYAFLAHAGIAQDKISQACVILDKIGKVDQSVIQEEITALAGVACWEKLGHLTLGDIRPDHLEDIARNAGAQEACQRLLLIRNLIGDPLREGDPLRKRVFFRPYLARGLDYYTGPIFEFRHPAYSGSLGGGGRYDKLLEKFGGSAVPACGGSIGFERVLLLLEESKTGPGRTGPEFCVLVFDESLREKSLELALRLRRTGKSVDLYPGTGKLKAQFKYADSKGAAYALIIGPDEAAAGAVKAKNLKTGEERLMKAEEFTS